jgi:hypothetical protein
MGGSFASQRHFFSVIPPAPKPPEVKKEVQPPPKRVLAQGRPTPARLSQAQIDALQTRIADFTEAVKFELEVVKEESDMVSGPTLRVEPDLYRTISIVGPVFTPQQIRTQITIDAHVLESAANRALTGAAAPYLTDEQRATLQTVVSDAKALTAYIQNFDLEQVTGDLTQLADDHAESHVKSAKSVLQSVERDIVSGEAPSIPVREPAETGFPFGAILAVSAIVVVGLILADIV